MKQIKDFIDERPMLSPFMHPPFWEDFEHDHAPYFFEKMDEDTSVYFKDTQIWVYGQKCRNYQGKYSVIFITFKDVKRDTWKETLDLLSKLIIVEFNLRSVLSDSKKLSSSEYYHHIVNGQANKNDYMLSLLMLSQMLHEHHGIVPIIIIDEYDTPIQQGHLQGFYDQVVLFMHNFFSGGLKDNKHLSYGFMTGILRVFSAALTI